MKRICAWCGRELDQVERRENQPLTHGLCPECRRRFFAGAKDQNGPLVENDEGEARADPPLGRP
jgi:hypothetical protein